MAREQTMKKTMLSKVRTYLAYRRSLGFRLKSEGTKLMKFARYADSVHHRGPLTNQLAIGWACLPKRADRLYRARRLEIVRSFARYLLQIEPQTQVPPRHLFGPAHRRPVPHLYSPAQIQQLLQRAGQLEGRLRPHTWQTLIGLLACAGLRVSEARRLLTTDVDWKRSLLVVRESKNGTTRLVPLHPTAMTALRTYAKRRETLFPLAQYFFVSERGAPLALSTVGLTFRLLRKGIPCNGRPPRLHDLRHTMASRVLGRWFRNRKEGVDQILVLSRFLGHTHPEYTFWYLSAFPGLLAEAAQLFAPERHEKS
jgi:integrase